MKSCLAISALCASLLLPAAASADVISLQCGEGGVFKVDVDTTAKTIVLTMYPKTTPYKMPDFTNVLISDDAFAGDFTYLEVTRHVDINRKTGEMHTTAPGKDMHSDCVRWTS